MSYVGLCVDRPGCRFLVGSRGVCRRVSVQTREVESWRFDHRACAQGDQHDEHHQQSGPDETGLWRNASLKVFIDDKSQVPAGVDMRSNALSHGFVRGASLVPAVTGGISSEIAKALAQSSVCVDSAITVPAL